LNSLKIALLTSSRADYGIYLPLLKAIKGEPFFELNIIAFGTHLSAKHGETISEILADGFEVQIQVNSVPESDTPAAISSVMGEIMISFSKIWDTNLYDLIIALGDRYEMFAACASSVPFAIPIAHIHGGETTLGAIDDSFRHSITQMSTYHFTAAEEYKSRVIELKASDKNVYNVGSLSIDNLKSMQLFTIPEFKDLFNIDLSIPSILITFHPETVDFQKNELYITELIAALKEISDYQLIITMPNADTMGNMIREQLQAFISKSNNAIGVESFGVLGYLSCMKHCSMMLGNTSSGFIEASFFSKYVINIGKRQSGRILTLNIRNCDIKKNEILKAVRAFKPTELSGLINIYGNGMAGPKIIEILKASFSE
jgi:GDP/UDP-N,N'-diacetylbacillosamine 2-epimerase (hydrolysing)